VAISFSSISANACIHQQTTTSARKRNTSRSANPPMPPGQTAQTKRMRRPSGSAHPMAIDIQGLANSVQPVLGLTGQVAGSIPAARTFPP
jgi:hypothetical protein